MGVASQDAYDAATTEAQHRVAQHNLRRAFGELARSTDAANAVDMKTVWQMRLDDGDWSNAGPLLAWVTAQRFEILEPLAKKVARLR